MDTCPYQRPWEGARAGRCRGNRACRDELIPTNYLTVLLRHASMVGPMAQVVGRPAAHRSSPLGPPPGNVGKTGQVSTICRRAHSPAGPNWPRTSEVLRAATLDGPLVEELQHTSRSRDDDDFSRLFCGL